VAGALDLSEFLYALRREVLRNFEGTIEQNPNFKFLYALRREVLRNTFNGRMFAVATMFLYALRREVLRNRIAPAWI